MKDDPVLPPGADSDYPILNYTVAHACTSVSNVNSNSFLTFVRSCLKMAEGGTDFGKTPIKPGGWGIWGGGGDKFWGVEVMGGDTFFGAVFTSGAPGLPQET